MPFEEHINGLLKACFFLELREPESGRRQTFDALGVFGRFLNGYPRVLGVLEGP